MRIKGAIAGRLEKLTERLAGVPAWLYWSALGVFLLALRAPLFLQNLQGEEGLFAFVALGTWKGPGTMIGAVVGGNQYYFNAEHPLPLYYLFRFLGYCVQAMAGEAGPRLLTAGLRAALGILNAAVLLGLCAVVEQKTMEKKSRGLFRIFCAATLSLLFVSFTAVHLQVEGAVGVTFISAAVAMALIAQSPGAALLALPAGIVAGLGKNEWSLLFAGAAVMALLFSRFKIINPSAIWLFLLAGLGIGNLLSYLSDPFNYLAGFDVMLRINEAASRAPFAEKIRYSGNALLVFTAPLLFLGFNIFQNGPRAAMKNKYGPIFIFSALCALAVFAGYFKAGWTGGGVQFPRYFAIIFPFIIVMLGATMATECKGDFRAVAAGAGILALALNIALHLNYYYIEKLTPKGQASRGSYAEAQSRLATGSRECINFTGPDVGFYLQERGFANKDAGEWYRQYTDLPPCP
jgi:hypothetical protein